MKDSDHNTLFEISALETGPLGNTEQWQLYSALRNLYDLARRGALDIDRKLEGVAGILDRI